MTKWHVVALVFVLAVFAVLAGLAANPVYLNVFEREVHALEDYALTQIATGEPDTSPRHKH